MKRTPWRDSTGMVTLTFIDAQTTYSIAFSRSPFHLKESRQVVISMGKENMPPTRPPPGATYSIVKPYHNTAGGNILLMCV